MKFSEIYHNEIVRRMELTEFHLLSIKTGIGADVIDHHVTSALLIMNPKNPVNNKEWIEKRIVELRDKYYDEFGRLKDEI